MTSQTHGRTDCHCLLTLSLCLCTLYCLSCSSRRRRASKRIFSSFSISSSGLELAKGKSMLSQKEEISPIIKYCITTLLNLHINKNRHDCNSFAVWPILACNQISFFFFKLLNTGALDESCSCSVWKLTT